MPLMWVWPWRRKQRIAEEVKAPLLESEAQRLAEEKKTGVAKAGPKLIRAAGISVHHHGFGHFFTGGGGS
jgi:hypothetical protein